MEIDKIPNTTKISPEKLQEIKVTWSILNEPSSKALDNFNRVLANAELRIYREAKATK